jgi:DNA polymerase-4
VGPKTEEELARIGVHTIGSLAALEPDRLARKLGTHGHDLMRLARGEDDRPVVAAAGEAKSLGQEHTFDRDVSDVGTLRATLLDLADAVARRLRSHGLRARTITLKYRDETFRTLTRAETLAEPTDAGDVLFRTVWRLFEGVHGDRRVRLLGIYTSGFGAGAQLDLFAPAANSADQVRDAVDRRFGEGTLTRASLIVYPERRHTPDRRGRRRLRR